jgi:hypothetical protein
MRRITEEEAYATAGEEPPPVLAKTEHDPTESAVTLKRWPEFWVLGISCDLDDRFEIYAFDDEVEAWAEYRRQVDCLAGTGRPSFGGAGLPGRDP